MRHEKARRQTFGGESGPSGFSLTVPSISVNTSSTGGAAGGVNPSGGSRPFIRRRVSEAPTGPGGLGGINRNESPALSPLNPKARTNMAPSTQTTNGLLSINPTGVLGGVPIANTGLPVNNPGPGSSSVAFGRSSPTLARQKPRAINQNQPQTGQGQNITKKQS